jgi:hypothetical protein
MFGPLRALTIGKKLVFGTTMMQPWWENDQKMAVK